MTVIQLSVIKKLTNIHRNIFQQTKDSIAHKAVISEGTQLGSILFYNKG